MCKHPYKSQIMKLNKDKKGNYLENSEKSRIDLQMGPFVENRSGLSILTVTKNTENVKCSSYTVYMIFVCSSSIHFFNVPW